MRPGVSLLMGCIVPSLLVVSDGHAKPTRLMSLRIAADHRRLETANGEPFFLVGDTAWEIFHRLDRRDAKTYIQTRKRQGFNAILAVALPEISIASEPNAHGDFPLLEKDPLRAATTPGADPANLVAYDFWDHVDYIVDESNRSGLYVGLVPSWGRWVNDEKDRIFNDGNARSWGQFIAKRFARKGVFFILGGDRHPRGFESVWRAMAQGLQEGATALGLPLPVMTFHPGAASSVPFFHEDNWLGFNATYSGHGKPGEVRPWKLIEAAYAKSPAKPVLDLEPIYEDIAFGIATFEHGYSSARDVRRTAYWDALAGACGVLYGNQSTWQMWEDKHKRIFGPLMPWQASLTREAAHQMQWVHKFVLARPLANRIPDQSLITQNSDDVLHQSAAQGPGYILAYSPMGRPLHIDLSRFDAASVKATWFDPRTGRMEPGGEFDNPKSIHVFKAPAEGDGADWGLILDGLPKTH